MAKLFVLVCLLATTASGQVQKIGGSYVVSKIESQKGGAVKVDFLAKEKTGKFDHLQLVSDHVHMGVKEGDTLRLSAEIVDVNEKGISIVSQVMLFLPTRQGSTPVWLLSKKHAPKGLNGARLLDMHAPSADYQVF